MSEDTVAAQTAIEETAIEETGVEETGVEAWVEAGAVGDDARDDALLETLLVEEVSIDGMCGVY